MSATARHTTATDALALRAIRLEALLDAPLSFGSTHEEVAAWPEEKWVEMASAPTTFIAERDGVVVGMARGGTNDHDPADSPQRWLWGMYVTPSARGDGTAAALIDAVAEWSRGDGGASLHLFVSSQAPRAHAFYEKVGFVDNGEPQTPDEHPDLAFQPMVRPL